MSKLSPLVGQALRPPRPGACPPGFSDATAFSRRWDKRPGILLVVILSGLLCGCGRVTTAGAPTPSVEEKQRQGKILFYVKAVRDSLNAIKADEDEDSEKKTSYMIRKEQLWNELVDLQAQGGDFEGAADTADIHRTTDDGGSAYYYVAAAQAQAGDIASAKASARHYRDTDPATMYSLPAAIALAEARAGDWSAAKAMLTPPPGNKDGPAGGLFDVLREGVWAGHPRETALLNQLLATAPEAKGEPWFDLQSLQTLQAMGFARAGKLDQARAVLPKITFPFFRVWILRNIALQEAWAGDRQGARDTLAPVRGLIDAEYAYFKEHPELEKQKGPHLWVSPSEYCWRLSGLANTWMLIGDAGEAKKTLERVKEEDNDQALSHQALAELAARQADAGDLAGAGETARSNPDENQRAKGLGLVAQAQIKQGHPEAARRNVEEAEGLLRVIRKKINSLAVERSARPVSLALAQLDGADMGVQFAKEMEPDEPGFGKIDSTEEIAVLVAQRQEPTEARKWVEEQTDDPHIRAMYYMKMGYALAEPAPTVYSMDTEP